MLPPHSPRRIPYGAVIISLDFELHWGVRDHTAPHGPYRRNLLGGREAIPRMLRLFQKFGVAVTWATVGFLFARNRKELTDFFPCIRPAYKKRQFDPYREPLGEDENRDPLHFGRSLVDLIRETPRQEIASHTFSHYFCLEEGQNAEAFRADLDSACRIAASAGIELKSLVLPRNQFNSEYVPAMSDAGLICFRGNQPGWMNRAADADGNTAASRSIRLADSYFNLSGHGLTSWEEVASKVDGVSNVRASRFLRPYHPRLTVFDSLRLRRIIQGMRAAAREKRIYHLWWHPHNFGGNIDKSMAFLTEILRELAVLRDRSDFRSLSMAEAVMLASTLTP